MPRSTQNTNLKTVIKPTDRTISASQQKQWSAMVVARLTQKLKSQSINKVLWGDLKK